MAGEEIIKKIKDLVSPGGDAINNNSNIAQTGLNMDQSVNQIAQGSLTYALNAAVENFDSNSVYYQNEQGNEFCLSFPEGYQLIGEHSIYEKNKHIFFLANPTTEDSEIGYMDTNDCVYKTLVNAKCLNFNIDNPIHKAVHKITNCTTEIYWTDGFNPRRYLDIDNIPYRIVPTSNLCDPVFSSELDCNKLNIQPNFNIPSLKVVDVNNGGNLTAGTYQFAIQYSSAEGDGYTSYYSVTNPTPIANPQITTIDFNYPVGKSIDVEISNIDVNGTFRYFNLAVIKTVNAITSVELVGTYFIDEATKVITYTGQNVTQIRLTINDIFEKFPYYEIAQDITTVQDVLVWDNLTSIDRINYQGIANQIQLEWETWRIPATETYADELNATNLRGYLRDEVYAFEIVFLLRNGKQTDGFHIPGRIATINDVIAVPQTNNDFIGEPDNPVTGTSPYWKIYNTATVTGFSPGYSSATDYKGPYQYGEFSYWESTEEYPCNTDVWGDLAGQKIRHHKFPDVLISPIFESPTFTLGPGFSPVIQKDAVYPIGVRINTTQITTLINNSSLTQEQKDNIVAFKIVRGDRSTNSSIVAKGILRNVGKYEREGNEYYFPNYPYNDLRQDPFLLDKSNAFTTTDGEYSTLEGYCRSFNITGYDNDSSRPLGTKVEYVNCNTGEINTIFVENGDTKTICALGTPVVIDGKACITSNTYKRYEIEILSGAPITIVFQVMYANGYGANATPPSPPCDFCNINPTDTFCLKSTIVNGKYVPVNLTLSGSSGTNVTVESIIKPIPTNSAFVEGTHYKITILASFGEDLCSPQKLEAFNTDDSKYRHVFNSPETSFGSPFLGNVLKLENVMFGAGSAHFVQVKKNAMYKLLTREAQLDALASADEVARMTTTYNSSALFAVYQSYLTIYINGITRRNYGWSFNSIASYDYSDIVDNNITISAGNVGIKQRPLEIAQYLIPGVLSVGDDNNINNYQRESSVYLKTDTSKTPLPFPSNTPSINGAITDQSRFTLSESPIVTHCNAPEEVAKTSVVSYYGSIKNIFVNQWGQIYSYDTIDTGFQRNILSSISPVYETVFGGDTFISKFAFKTKLPFFIDNRVGAPDDSDIFYDEIGNVAYPQYWHSARSVLSNGQITDGSTNGANLKNFISVKAHNFDCPNKQTPADSPGRTYYDGKMYMFAYGIPYFYCESSYNVDLRQAFNNKEGDFWPHVSTDIPDDWVQESFVSIINDNTYFYNTTFSKQNRENFFSHLPPDWEQKLCFTVFPFRAIYSDKQLTFTTNQVNNWLVYRPISSFDFPQNYGNLISLDGIQNRAVLARFENKSLLYNTLLTVETSNPQAAYLGNDTLFRSAPPIDFAETDLGYVGSQNKFLLKIPQGQVTIDAKRGQIFLISGNQATDLTGFGSGMNRFFTDHLAFEILRYFPDVDTDNHFNGIGLHGVFDSKFERIIITKLDYIPINKNIKYDSVTKEFYIETITPQVTPSTTTTTSSSTSSTSTTSTSSTSTTSTSSTSSTTSTTTTLAPLVTRQIVYLEDTEYFCNKSWTLSYNLNTRSWISFHSYIPNWYIAENNFFYSGSNDCCGDFDAVVAVPIPEPTTTTTTSTSTSSTTTTTTTVAPSPYMCFEFYLESESPSSYNEQLLSIGNGPMINDKPTYDFSGGLGSIKIYYDGTQWVYYNADLGGVVQTLASTSQYPESDGITPPLWLPSFIGDPSAITGLILTSVFGECPTTTTTTSSTSSTTTTTTTEAPFTCECYYVLNEIGSPSLFSYIACNGTDFSNTPIAAGDGLSICARVGTVFGNVGVTIVPTLSPCVNDGDCIG